MDEGDFTGPFDSKYACTTAANKQLPVSVRWSVVNVLVLNNLGAGADKDFPAVAG